MSDDQTSTSLPSRTQVHHAPERTVWYRKWWVIAGLIVVVAALVFFAFQGRGQNQDASQSGDQQSGAVADSAEDETTEDQSGPVVPSPDEPGTDPSADCEAALVKAREYAETLFMSEAAIQIQLTGPDGDGFSPEAADCAVDELDWDWNANALEKAKMYAEDPDMTPEDIYDQLISEYGERFTPQQAQYAIDELFGS